MLKTNLVEGCIRNRVQQICVVVSYKAFETGSAGMVKGGGQFHYKTQVMQQYSSIRLPLPSGQQNACHCLWYMHRKEFLVI